MIVPLYVSRRFVFTLLRVIAIVAALVFAVELVEHIRRYADDVSSFHQILWLTILRVPQSIEAAFALIILISSITLFVSLARSSEMVIFRAAGISALRLVLVPVGISILIGIGVMSVLNPVIAGTERSYEQLRSTVAGNPTSTLSISEGGLWLRQSTDGTSTIINAERAHPDGSLLIRPVFYVFDTDGVLHSRVAAREAVLSGEAWVLSDVSIWEQSADPMTQPNVVREASSDEFATDLTSDQILDSFVAPTSISFWQLPGFIQNMETSGFSATRHRQFFQSTLATPVLFAAMVLIGAAFTMRHVRFGNTGVMVLFAVLCGFLLYMLRNLATSLGSAGEIPVSIAAWAPPSAAILLVLGYLLHIEDG